MAVQCIWTGPSPKKYYMDLRSFGPYNICLVTDRSISCHMTLSAMNYLLFMHLFPNTVESKTGEENFEDIKG
jgi:hypothetical protein